ncbi:hypothetical protein P3S67_006726 [Capsicum chacoense]
MALSNTNVGDETSEVLAAQAHIVNHVLNYVNSMSLKCATQLGIPDIIHSHGRAMSLSDLIDALPINKVKGQECIYRLMRILIHAGFFIQEEEGDEPRLNCLFNESMASDARLITSVLIKNGKGIFEGLKSVVDVGGGTGAVGKAISNAFPELKYIVFDLPHVVEGLEGSNNLSYIGGDMFKSVPSADAILLKWILHDWSNEDCVKILKKCKEAIPSKENGGKLIVIDIVIDNKNRDDKSFETQLFSDVLMMVHVSGKERSEQEWTKLFFDAGFSDYKISPILGLRSVIEVYP